MANKKIKSGKDISVSYIYIYTDYYKFQENKY